MKTKHLIYSGIVALVFCLPGCEEEENLTDILVDEPVSIVLGYKTILTVNSIPSDARIDQREVSWKSENELIATVTQLGLLEAVEEGSTNIIATYKGISKTIPVTVTDPVQLPASRNASWLFDDASNPLKAEIGQPLQYGRGGSGFDFRFECPTTDLAGFSPVAGPSVPANNKALRVAKGYFLQAAHGIAPNGGGTTKVNEYTIMMEINIPSTSGNWKTLYQTDPQNADGDADVFVRGQNIGVGTSGYSEGDVVTGDTWHRIVVTLKSGESLKYYCDGALVKNYAEAGNLPIDGDNRFALASTLLFFGDNDGDDDTLEVSEIAMWNTAFTPDQVKKLERLMNKR
jgi:hypothetical protein